jgi:hypothetical protein
LVWILVVTIPELLTVFVEMTSLRKRLLLAALCMPFVLTIAAPSRAQGDAKSVLVASGLTQPLYVTGPVGDGRLSWWSARASSAL